MERDVVMKRWESVDYNTRSIYHLLSRAFGQCVSVPEIIDFDITNVVAVSNVHVAVDGSDCASLFSRANRCRRSGRSWAVVRSDRRDVDMLDGLLSSELCLNTGGDGSWAQR